MRQSVERILLPPTRVSKSYFFWDFLLTHKAFVLCCNRTSFHASTAFISEDYLTRLAEDSLSENQYLALKQGKIYDLSDATQRYNAVRQILGIMRYLTKFPLLRDSN